MNKININLCNMHNWFMKYNMKFLRKNYIPNSKINNEDFIIEFVVFVVISLFIVWWIYPIYLIGKVIINFIKLIFVFNYNGTDK